MVSNNNDPKKTGFLGAVIQKLSPQSIERIFLLTLVLGGIIAAVAVNSGRTIKFFGIEISAVRDETNTPNPDENPSLDTGESPDDQRESPYLEAQELTLISDTYFNQISTKKDMIASIKYLVNSTTELNSYKNNFSFKLLKVELSISKFGGSSGYINTNIIKDNEDRREAFKEIQVVLQEIGKFEGSIDGNQQTTATAVKNFQKELNAEAQSKREPIIIDPKDYGLFGYRTLEAVRSAHIYRAQN